MARTTTGAEPVFGAGFEVRDCELDAQGIVINANYLHYFKHSRHRFQVAASARVESAIVSGGRSVPASPEMIERLFAPTVPSGPGPGSPGTMENMEVTI